jgi:hypothetical protein
MAEALDPAAYIYEGIWTNWSKGRVTGLTWTLCPTQATLLTNSLALFVTVAGGQLWTIIRFTVHQLRASGLSPDEDELHFEQQLILRNAATDLHTMRLMTQLAWTSRHRMSRAFYYPVSIAALAVIHYIIFLAAGTLSNNLVNAGSGGLSKLANGSSAVLSRSPHCGVWSQYYYDNIINGAYINVASRATLEMSIQYNKWFDQNVQLSQQYAQECYDASPSYYMSSKCNTLPKTSLGFNQTKSTCPFDSTLCHDNSDTISFDTGLIDSHQDLGINSLPSDRLSYRRRTTCAVLNDTGRVEEFDRGTSDAVAYMYYGSNLAPELNYTYSYSNFSSLYTEFTNLATTPYQLNTQLAFGASPISEYMSIFEPIAELKQDTADLTLFFLSYTGRYFQPVNDPWFSAREFHSVDTPAPIARNQYARDKMVSTLGCTEQHLFCKPSGVCTPFLGWGQVQESDTFMSSMTPHQRVVFDRMIEAVLASGLAYVVPSLAASKTPLLATEEAAAQAHVMSLGLPDNQWQLELKFWHSIAMAQLQRNIVQWSTGQIASDPQTQLVRAESEPGQWFCKNLIIPSTVYQSFSVVWLTLILSVGMLVILVSWTIEDVTAWMHMRSRRGSALRKVWDEHHILRLKEALPRGSWRPSPPPKDSGPEKTALGIQYDEKSIPPPLVRSPQAVFGTARPGHGFSWFRASLPGPDTGRQDRHVRSPEISTPRLWSTLPPEPSRDSWVEVSLNGYDFENVERPADFVDHDSNLKCTTSIPGPARPARTLEISDLRAHALARTRSAWV